MFVRMGSFAVKPDALEALRATYNEACAPLVRAEEGNVDCFLLEPVDAKEGVPVVACTMWRTEADALRYEASGKAQEIVAKVRSYFAGPPKLDTYRVVR